MAAITLHFLGNLYMSSVIVAADCAWTSQICTKGLRDISCFMSHDDAPMIHTSMYF